MSIECVHVRSGSVCICALHSAGYKHLLLGSTCCCVQVLYPAMRAMMGDMAPDDAIDAHTTLKYKLTELANTPVYDPNHDGLVQEYMKVKGQSKCRLYLIGTHVLYSTAVHCRALCLLFLV